MVRVGGLTYACAPGEKMGNRVQDLRLAGRPLDPSKTYRVAGWAPVAEEARGAGNKQVWDVLESWLKAKGRVAPRPLNTPQLIGVRGNSGLA